MTPMEITKDMVVCAIRYDYGHTKFTNQLGEHYNWHDQVSTIVFKSPPLCMCVRYILQLEHASLRTSLHVALCIYGCCTMEDSEDRRRRQARKRVQRCRDD